MCAQPACLARNLCPPSMDAVLSVDSERALTMHLTMPSFQSGRNNHAKTSSSRKEAGRGRDCPSTTLRRSVRATNQVELTRVRETLADRLSAKQITDGSRLELSATATAARRRTCQRSTVTSQCTTTGFTVILATLVQRKFNHSFRIYCPVRRLYSRRLWRSRSKREIPSSYSNHTRC